MTQIDHTKPYFDNDEIEALKTLIKTRQVNEGEHTNELVNKISGFANAKGGVATSTGTLGIHLGLKALGVESDNDEVIIPDFACRSLCDSVRMAGATPVFCDINLEDYSLNVDSVKLALNKKTKAIIAPHMFGQPTNINKLMELGVSIIEDCAHALSASFKGSPVGSFGNLSVFSFEGSKLVSAGEGGVVLANTNEMLEKLNTLRYGFNGNIAHHYRLSNLVAVVALTQINKLHSMVKRRKYIAKFYQEKLKKLEGNGFFKLPRSDKDQESVYYRFVILCKSNSKNLIKFANERGVLIRNPLTSGCLSDTFKGISFNNNNAKILAQNGVSLPIYPDLTDKEMLKIVCLIESFYK